MLAGLFGWLRGDTSGGGELVDDTGALFQPRRRLRPARPRPGAKTEDQRQAEAFHRILMTDARKRKGNKS